MKKTISILLILVMSVFMLTACGDSGPDLTEVKKKYNQAADVFNEAAKLVNANGWKDDAESLKQHNELADSIEEIKKVIEDPEKSKGIDVGAMSADLDKLISALNEYKEAVSVPFAAESKLDLTALIAKYDEIQKLHTKVSSDAQANGWLEDEELVTGLNDIADAMEVSYKTIKDPSLLEGGDLVQADVDEYVKILSEFIPVLKEFQGVVSAPYDKK